MCILWFHEWDQSRPLSYMDAFPPPKWTTARRHCLRCGKREHWLPGYGGSEWGSWQPDRGRTPE